MVETGRLNLSSQFDPFGLFVSAFVCEPLFIMPPLPVFILFGVVVFMVPFEFVHPLLVLGVVDVPVVPVVVPLVDEVPLLVPVAAAVPLVEEVSPLLPLVAPVVPD